MLSCFARKKPGPEPEGGPVLPATGIALADLKFLLPTFACVAESIGAGLNEQYVLYQQYQV